MSKLTIGIDIGGTNTVMGIVDKEGNVIARGGIDTPDHGDIKRYVKDMATTIRELISSLEGSHKGAEILGIGIGAPNGNYHKGTIEHPPNLSFKGVSPVIDLLKDEFPDFKYLALTNDANAAALGEMVYGGARDMKDFVMYTLGTGVGGGLVVNGDLVYGHDGFGGEVGHTTLVPGGRLCGCGASGHLEAYCSAPGMKRTAFELIAKYNASDSLLADKSYNELDSKAIYEAAVKGDKIALEVFEITGYYLGLGLADTVHNTSPEAIFLFGGPTAAGDLIFKPAKESMEKLLLPVFRNKIEILKSELSAGDAPIVGASALVWKETEK